VNPNNVVYIFMPLKLIELTNERKSNSTDEPVRYESELFQIYPVNLVAMKKEERKPRRSGQVKLDRKMMGENLEKYCRNL
jgi:hypothetical protein